MALQVELLESSFRELSKQGDKLADVFYSRLFSMYPEVRPLFENADMPEQKKKLVAALKLVIDNLTNSGALSPALKELGRKHDSYNVRREHFPMVGAALITSFAEILKENWTPEMKDAWIEAYDEIVDMMMQGYKEPQPV